MAMPWEVSKKRDLVIIYHEVGDCTDWEQWHLLRSDAHWDSPQCDRLLEKRHLDEAVSRNAAILDCGDMFDAMQGRDDNRRQMSEMRAEHRVDAYFSELLNSHSAHLAPYAKNIAYLSEGNHERAVLKHNGIALTKEVVRRLRAEHNAPTIAGGYEGFVRFVFRFNGTERHSKLLYHTHGAGGASEGTRGTIKINRRQSNIPDPNIYMAGHSHHAWSTPTARIRLSAQGQVYEDMVWHLQIPSYKKRGPSFEPEREMIAKPRGAYWLIFTHRNKKLNVNVMLAM